MTAQTTPTPQEEAERENVDASAEMVQIAADGVKLGKMIGRTDLLTEVVRHVNGALNTAPYSFPHMPPEWLNGYKDALHRVGLYLAKLSAEETS